MLKFLTGRISVSVHVNMNIDGQYFWLHAHFTHKRYSDSNGVSRREWTLSVYMERLLQRRNIPNNPLVEMKKIAVAIGPREQSFYGGSGI